MLCRKASLAYQINTLSSKHSFRHGNSGKGHVLKNEKKINIEKELHCRKFSMHHMVKGSVLVHLSKTIRIKIVIATLILTFPNSDCLAVEQCHYLMIQPLCDFNYTAFYAFQRDSSFSGAVQAFAQESQGKTSTE